MTNSKKRSPARVGARNRAGNNFNGYPYTIDFHSINQAAVPALPAILGRLLSGGKIMGGEYVALNPTRADHRPGSFKINVRTNGYPYTIDFHSINQAAVPALPAILGRLLSGGKIMGGEYVALNLRGQTIGRARSRLMFAPAIGPTSLAATRAAIP